MSLTSLFNTATSLRTSVRPDSTPARRDSIFLQVASHLAGKRPDLRTQFGDGAPASHGFHFRHRSIGCCRIHPGGQQRAKQGAVLD